MPRSSGNAFIRQYGRFIPHEPLFLDPVTADDALAALAEEQERRHGGHSKLSGKLAEIIKPGTVIDGEVVSALLRDPVASAAQRRYSTAVVLTKDGRGVGYLYKFIKNMLYFIP